MAKTAQETDRVVGIVLRAFPARKAGKYTVYDFVLRTPTGDLKVSRFGSNVQDFVGENVAFEATYNDQYDRYTVQGELEAIDAPAVQTVAEVVPHADVVEAPKAKRGRPTSGGSRTGKSEAQVVNVIADGSREGYRNEAVQSVILNLASAQHIADQLNYKANLQDLVALGDMVGRTITATKLSAEKRG